MYQILEWTPFPNVFRPMANCQLQTAEWALQLNSCGYYEHARQTTNGLVYPLDIAEKIVTYWTFKYPFADYQLKLRVGEFE